MACRYVYLFRFGEMYKIGVSTSPSIRLTQVCKGEPDSECLHAFPSGSAFAVESALHRRFADNAVPDQNEWFALSQDAVSLICSVKRANAVADLPQPLQPPPPPAPSTSTARLPVELLRQARVVAAYRDIDLGEYLVELLRGPVARDYALIVREAKPKD
jgi:hypothetical protein